MPGTVLAIDQGTTSTRAAVFDAAGVCRGWSARELTQLYPRPGWVEHDPEEIWHSVAAVVPDALERAGIRAADLTAIGITNQRETVLFWDRATGKSCGPAIVWQDRRTAAFCREHAAEEPWIRERTGLLLDPYFSATKLRWLLDADAALRAAADAGRLAAGTVDTFLLWRLTAGRAHRTDVTNASRTLLFDVRRLVWDADLCRFFGVPGAVLPEVSPSVADFGVTAGLHFLPDGLPVRGIAGDQQAALFGQGGFSEGAAKCTYGTGAFFLQHTGTRFVQSRHRLLASVAAMPDITPRYVLEGSVFVAGAAVQWLRDGLKLFARAEDVEPLAAGSDREQPVLFVPGFVGLGAP
jgi:glycerol kinase